jgi:peptidoglycan/xylan/chitin deacetylase (PgdA/CDA1 family)
MNSDTMVKWTRIQEKIVGPPWVQAMAFAFSTRAAFAAATMAAMIFSGPALAQGPVAQSQLSGAVIFMFHRFGEVDVPSTNIRLEQFQAHLAELKSGGYAVMGLPEIIQAMSDGQPLPDRTIGLTIDDAFLSAYTKAWPALRDAGFPVTVFVSTDVVNAGGAQYMNWDQLRDLAAQGVTIGAHSASHLHMIGPSMDQITGEIERSNSRFQAELGFTPTLFAYPYGEMSLAVRDVVIGAGFVAAFGQHSGVAEAGLDRFYLPRFSLNEQYGALSRFTLAANALPLGAREIVPAEPALTSNPPAFGFTVSEVIGPIDQINCFASHESTPARLERLGPRRFEVRLQTPFPAGRGRFNCTAPTDDGRWRWFGMQFYIPAP